MKLLVVLVAAAGAVANARQAAFRHGQKVKKAGSGVAVGVPPTTEDEAKALFQGPFPAKKADSSGLTSEIFFPKVLAVTTELPGTAAGQTVVVKTVNSDAPGAQTKDCTALQAINSPRVTTCIADWPAINWIVMQPVLGEPLYDSAVAGCLQGDDAKGKKAFKQVLKGAKAIMTANYLHDDMKPKNVMYDAGSEAFTWIDVGFQPGSGDAKKWCDPEMKAFSILSAYALVAAKPGNYDAEQNKSEFYRTTSPGKLNKALTFGQGFFDTPGRRNKFKDMTQAATGCSGVVTHASWGSRDSAHTEIIPGKEVAFMAKLQRYAPDMPDWMAEATCLLLKSSDQAAYDNAIAYLDGTGAACTPVPPVVVADDGAGGLNNSILD